jgi:hypothetical protein
MKVQARDTHLLSRKETPMTWNHGYNADLGYTFGYYREQAPTLDGPYRRLFR